MPDSTRARVSIIGVVCIALFAALFARLWFLQVVSGEDFEAKAQENSTRELQAESPRGRILDRDGNVLVDNSTITAVTVERAAPREEIDLALGRLAELFGAVGVVDESGEPVDIERLRARYDDPRASQFRPAVVAADVPPEIVVAISEREEDFPHVSVVELPIRNYPNDTMAAHLLGYSGEISDEQLLELESNGYQPGESIGKTGVESAYEADLRGVPRRERVEVDPANQRVSDEPLDVFEGRPGHDVVLTLDSDVQRRAEEALADAISQSQEQQNPGVEDRYETFAAPAGSVVVLDVDDGSVVAMASYPTFNPEAFIGGIPQILWEILNADGAHEPLNNRATQGLYAPGSTFKLMTALAALDEGLRTSTTPYDDQGVVEIEGQTWRNAGGVKHGVVDLRAALSWSVDTYFYEIGRELWRCFYNQDTCAEDGEAVQQMARRFGFGSGTGIALSEAEGRVPDETWKRDFVEQRWTDEAVCRSASFGWSGEELDCETLRAQIGQWLPGDSVNLSIGQGDLLVTPLQLANAYAAFANGGTLWKPRIAERVIDQNGETVREVDPELIREIDIDTSERSAVLAGLIGSTTEERGTAVEAFEGFPLEFVPVAAKTGTAEIDQKGDTSLFAAMVPATDPEYVVVAVVEQAGFGSRVAAPIARQVIEELYELPPSKLVIPEQRSGSVD